MRRLSRALAPLIQSVTMPRSRFFAVAPKMAAGGIVAVAVGSLIAIANGRTAPHQLAMSVAIAAIYTGVIGIPISWLFAVVPPRIEKWPPLAQWCLFVTALSVITVAGCLMTGAVLMGLGVLSADQFWRSFGYGLRIALVVGAVCTLVGAIYDGLRQRLMSSELSRARALTLAAEARLSALAARVHPHFLFNALNSVASLIHDDPVRAEALLGRLAAILRFSLDAEDRGLVGLGEELDIVRDYLEIERARLGDRLQCTIAVGDYAGDAKVPPLAIQVLVENSVRHAIASRRAGGAMTIAARRAGDLVDIEVWDDGPGFSEAAITAGHGLDNVRGRLGSLFGDAGRLSLARRQDGMAVTLSVPAP